MISHRVIIRDNSSGDLYEIFPTSWSFGEELNHPPEAKLSFSFSDVQRLLDVYGETVLNVFTAKLTELYIERNTTKKFYGVLSGMGVKPDADGDKDVSINAIGWLGLFSKRVVGIPKRVYTATDVGAIIWDLIDYSQTRDTEYDWGITQGSITTSKNRDRTYRFDNILESIIRLSNDNLADGVDVEIDVTKDLNVYYPTKGTTRTGLIFNSQNLKSWSWEKPLVLSLANEAHVLGEGQNDDVLYVTRTSAGSYRTPFGALEEVLREQDIISTDTLNDKGDRFLADNQATDPRLEIEHFDDQNRIQFSDYNLGDTIYVDLPDMNINKEAYRIMAYEYKMSKDSVGLVSLELEKA